MAPQVRLELTTDRLTADCSTTELLRNNNKHIMFDDKNHYSILANCLQQVLLIPQAFLIIIGLVIDVKRFSYNSLDFT